MLPNHESDVEQDTLHAYEQTLVARVRQGNEEAFSAIVIRYSPGLLSFTKANVHSREVAEDIVQELFLSLWSRRVNWVVERSLRTYLYQSVRKRILNYWRDRRPEERQSDSDILIDLTAEIEDPSQGHADAILEESEIRRVVDKTVECMPPRVKQVFLLSRTRELSYAEIAEILGIAKKTVEIHMGRALALLRKNLRDWR